MRSRWFAWLLAVISLAGAAAPFALPSIPVSANLVNHLFVAQVLAEYSNPLYRYDKAFELVLTPKSTVLGELALASLVKIAGAFPAARLYYVLFVAVLFLSAFYMARLLNAGVLLAICALPLAHTFFVFSGFLPFMGSLALYPLVPAFARRQPRGTSRIFMAVLLIVIYGFHLMGAFAACFTAITLALLWNRAWKERIADALATLPTAGLAAYFVLRESVPGKWIYAATPAAWLKAFLGYNVWGTSRIAGYFLLALIVSLGLVLARQGWLRRADPGLLASAAGLTVLGLALPIEIGEEFVIGSRMLPFAIIAGLAAMGNVWNFRQWQRAAAPACLFLVISGILNTAAAFRVQPFYREFLSGAPAIEYGSRILPVIADLDLGGDEYIAPFTGIQDAYNILRGGSNPDCFAGPARGPAGGAGVRNGSMMLNFRYPQTYSFKFSSAAPDFRGVSRDYDAVIIFGSTGRAAAALRDVPHEMNLAFAEGRLAVYKRL